MKEDFAFWQGSMSLRKSLFLIISEPDRPSDCVVIGT